MKSRPICELQENEDRHQQLEKNITDIYDYKTLLYVGARDNRFLFGDTFFSFDYKITLVEAFKKNCDYLETLDMIDEIHHLDILELNKSSLINNKFDIVMWIHGPEHVYKKEFEKILPSLEKITNKHLVLMCPWGEYPQGAIYGNSYEIHKQAYYPEDFEKLGFKTSMLGTMGVDGSNLMACKKLNAQLV
ncbi:MAG: hypothetical protein KZQ83_06960 [gamma proteobacterium symbiont of Taylorina sp.]|nr:hypothetical protein [gamma proteobacterium symbiont of Taylorina sp.]